MINKFYFTCTCYFLYLFYIIYIYMQFSEGPKNSRAQRTCCYGQHYSKYYCSTLGDNSLVLAGPLPIPHGQGV